MKNALGQKHTHIEVILSTLHRWLSNQRSYLKEPILFLFLKLVSHVLRQIEHLDFVYFKHSMECYKPINKGHICT